MRDTDADADADADADDFPDAESSGDWLCLSLDLKGTFSSSSPGSQPVL